MAELLVFTLLAAIAAIYALLPRHRQLRVRYNLWTKPRLGFITLMFLIIIGMYWMSIFLQIRDGNQYEVAFLDTSATITPLHVESVQLLAVLGIVLPLVALFLKQSVRIKNEGNIQEILRDLYYNEEYATLVDLLNENYRPLVNHPDRPTHPESPTLVYRLSLEEDEPESRWKAKFEKKQRYVRYYWGTVRYRLENTAESASDYTERLLLDPDFIELYSGVGTELGLKILSDDSMEGHSRKDITHHYLREQIKTENSLLARDLRHVEHDGLYDYKIENDNRLLHTLLSDFNRVESLDVYKPIGDQTRELIQEEGRQDVDTYNGRKLADTSIGDDYIYQDPIFIGIKFFDVMVREAFQQEVDWHVWLSYYESFTKEICRNYEITAYSDPNSEWPNDYSRFLYELIHNMLDWLRILEEELKPDVDRPTVNLESVTTYEIDPDTLEVDPSTADNSENTEDFEDREQESSDSDVESNEDDECSNGGNQANSGEIGEHVEIGRISTDRGERNIPEMTVIVLFSCHEEILTCDEIPTQFMAYLTESIFLLLLDFRKYAEGSIQWQFSELMLECLNENINGRRSNPTYRNNLITVYNGDYGDHYTYGVRHEVTVKDTEMTDLVDELDDLIGV